MVKMQMDPAPLKPDRSGKFKKPDPEPKISQFKYMQVMFRFYDNLYIIRVSIVTKQILVNVYVLCGSRKL